MSETHTDSNQVHDKSPNSKKAAAKEHRPHCAYSDHVLASSNITPVLSSIVGFNPENAEDYRWHIVDKTRDERTFYVLTFDVVGLFWKGLQESQTSLAASMQELCVALIKEAAADFLTFQLFQSDEDVKLDGNNGIRATAVIATDEGLPAEIPSIHRHLTDWADDWVGRAEKLEVRMEGIASQEAKVLLGLMTSAANAPELTIA